MVQFLGILLLNISIFASCIRGLGFDSAGISKTGLGVGGVEIIGIGISGGGGGEYFSSGANTLGKIVGACEVAGPSNELSYLKII